MSGWLARASDAGLAVFEDKSATESIADNATRLSCVACGSLEIVATRYDSGAVCRRCGVVSEAARISADDGLAVARHRREPDLLDEQLAQLKRARNSKDDRRRTQQSYQRQYHFNERMAARQNTEPRVGSDDLRLIGDLLRCVLGIEEKEIDARLLVPELIKQCCKALFPKKKASILCERWLQIRYFLITGNRERVGSHLEHREWDVEWMRWNEVAACRSLFKELARCFDELYYRPSAKRTTKDSYVKPNEGEDARHNMLQLDYVIPHLIYMLFGRERYEELKTPFCFPLNPRSPKALSKLDRMFKSILAHYNAKTGSDLRFTQLFN